MSHRSIESMTLRDHETTPLGIPTPSIYKGSLDTGGGTTSLDLLSPRAPAPASLDAVFAWVQWLTTDSVSG